METEPTKTFARTLRGYHPAAVDAHIEMLTAKQQLLANDIESLTARVKESGEEAAALHQEIAVLADTSSAPHAVQRRMAKMLRTAIDEASEMQAEAEALIAAAKTEAEQTREKLAAELAHTRAESQAAIDKAWRDAERERTQLLAEAKQEADHDREQARRALDEASRQRIKILEQLADVHRDLTGVPAALESAQRDRENPPEAGDVVALEQKTG